MADELDVTADFDAHVGDFVSNIELAINAAERFRDSIVADIEAIEAMHEALDDLPTEHLTNVSLVGEDQILEQVAEIREYLAALPEQETIHVRMDTSGLGGSVLAGAGAGLGTGPEAAAAGLRDEAAAAGESAIANGAASASANDLAKNEYLLAMAARMNANTQRDAAVSTAAAGAAAGGAAGGWGLLTHNFQTFGGAAEMALGRSIPLVTSIAGWHLLLDATAEGIIALSGALIALGAAAAGMAPSFLDIYTNLKSTRDVIEAFGVSIKPFNSWFLNLQHAMQTQAIELYGEALLDLGKANSTVARDIEDVGGAIDRMGAKISEWIGSNTNFGETIKKGAQYARDFGDILGNLIVIVDDLIKADSGIVSVLLGIFAGFTKAAAAVLGFSEGLDRFLLVAHGILLWGGLLSSMLINVAVMFLRPVANMIAFAGGVQGASAAIRDFEVANDTAATPVQKLGIIVQTAWAGIASMAGNVRTWIGGIGTAMSGAEGVVATAGAGMRAAFSGVGQGLLALATSPWTWAIAGAAALAYLGYEFSQVSSDTKTFLANWNSLESSDTASQFLVDSGSEISQIYGTKLPQSMKAAAAGMTPFYNAFHGIFSSLEAPTHGVASGFAAIGDALKDMGKAAVDYIPDLIVGQQAQNSVNAYKAAIAGLSANQQTLFKVAGTTMKENSVGFAQALGLMDAAGIKSGENFGEDMTQVEGLVAGYKALGEKGGNLQSTINAVTLAAEVQESEISQVTGAWTAFISLITGGESSFVTVAQQMAGTLSAAGGAAATLSISNGKVTDSIKSATAAAGAAKVHIDALSTAGLALKSSFIQTVQSMSGSINSLLQLSSAGGQGAKGIREVDQAGKDYVASLLPLAKGSQDATAMLYALAQQAGYTGADSFKSLAQWVGNIKHPMEQAESITQRLTVAAGNLATDVTNLANAINTNLATAMATAISGGSKVQTALDNMYTALHKNSDIMDGAVKKAAQNLAVSLLDDLGGNVDSAKGKFEAFYIMMGESKTAADKMWASVVRLAQAMDGIHNVSATISVNEYVTGSTAPSIPVGVAAPAHNAAGTPSASPGWSWVGEAGPELVKFHGGETVVPNHAVGGYAGGAGWYDGGGYFPGLAPVLSGASGGSSGGHGGGLPVLELHLHGDLADKNIWENGQIQTLRYNYRNSGKPTGAVKPS